MIFNSDREGYKNHGGHGVERDVFIMFFDADAYDRFLMTKEEKALLDEAQKETLKENKKESKKEAAKPSVLSFDLDNCRKRTARLTVNSSHLGDAVLTAKGDTLYYLAAFEGNLDLWKHDLLENKTEIVLKNIGYGSLAADAKLKNLFVTVRGGIKKIELAKGKMSDVDFESVFNYRPYEERKNLFEHIWRQVADKFYRTDLHGVDWAGYRDIYAKFLPHISNEFDFRDMLSELLGELNAPTRVPAV